MGERTKITLDINKAQVTTLLKQSDICKVRKWKDFGKVSVRIILEPTEKLEK